MKHYHCAWAVNEICYGDLCAHAMREEKKFLHETVERLIYSGLQRGKVRLPCMSVVGYRKSLGHYITVGFRNQSFRL